MPGATVPVTAQRVHLPRVIALITGFVDVQCITGHGIITSDNVVY